MDLGYLFPSLINPHLQRISHQACPSVVTTSHVSSVLFLLSHACWWGRPWLEIPVFLQNTPCTKGFRKQAWLRKCPTFLKHLTECSLCWALVGNLVPRPWRLLATLHQQTPADLRCRKCFLLGGFSWNSKHLFDILLVRVAARWHLWGSVF